MLEFRDGQASLDHAWLLSAMAAPISTPTISCGLYILSVCRKEEWNWSWHPGIQPQSSLIRQSQVWLSSWRRKQGAWDRQLIFSYNKDLKRVMRSRFRFQFCLCRLLKNYPPNPWSPPVSLSRHSLVQARTLGISLSLTTPPLPNHPKSHKVISQISHKLACFLTISTTVTLVSPSSCTSYCKPLFSSLPFNILTPLQFILPIFISSKSGIYIQP